MSQATFATVGTGAFISPEYLPHIKWVVDSFQDETYRDGECLNAEPIADSED